MLKIQKIALLCALLFSVSLFAQVDLTVFSYDRPLQLYALLESIDHNVTGLERQTVIYRASSDTYERGYSLVKGAFPHVVFKEQNHANAKADFKPLCLSAAFDPDSSSAYALFAVDDIIVTRPIDLKVACSQMESTHAYGYFFRLGLDIDHCYMVNQSSGLPKGSYLDGAFTWKVFDGRGDWGYPNNVDFTLYRKADIYPFFQYGRYTFPNDLEAGWAQLADQRAIGICPLKSALINVPMNVVSNFNNRSMHYKSTGELLELFLKGYKIDISALQEIPHNSPHFEVEPEFILR